MIPIVWSEHVAMCRGSAVKRVPCEFCGTEYVYVLKREATGSGTSLYLLDEDGARERASANSEDALKSYLENDYDPVPCPACGNYQRHMFPKLYAGGSPWVHFGRLAALVVCCLCGLGAAFSAISALQHGNWRYLTHLSIAFAVGLVFGVAFRILGSVDRAQVERFDPNTVEGQQERLALARQRAITRAEFDALQTQARTEPPAPAS